VHALPQCHVRQIVAEAARIKVNDDTQATGRPGIYAAGDCANGAKEVVNAVAEGKRAAEAIHAYLMGRAEPWSSSDPT
jgi:NADPH-dependent glutamate synthase beta subunit-like oxidoreductase